MSEEFRDPAIEKLLECGIIAVDKPQGPSSHQVTAWVREIFGGDIRIGHGGTLDPMVSGVLIIMLGRAVRLAPVILKHKKEYIVVMRLHGDVLREDICKTAEEFSGRVYQRPPRKSAVRRQLRIRTIYNIEILDIKDSLVLMRVACEAGTYIRSLCIHMALAMGVGGQMEELRRSESGSLFLSDSCTLQDLKDAFVFYKEGNPGPLKKMLLPAERLVAGIPSVRIRDSAVEAVCSGAVLAGVGVLEKENFRRDAIVAVMTEKNELVCLGKALVSSEEFSPGDNGLVVSPLAVIMKRGTYRKGWTKKSHSQNNSGKKKEEIKNERGGKSEIMADEIKITENSGKVRPEAKFKGKDKNQKGNMKKGSGKKGPVVIKPNLKSEPKRNLRSAPPKSREDKRDGQLKNRGKRNKPGHSGQQQQGQSDKSASHSVAKGSVKAFQPYRKIRK
ncbi:putative rRNA pseudouridine synthase [Methanomicrobium sp. W14]|uniref:RNA-guided pseudouridylation complex pseudouridine synthase subunit Cbf5 n=1 Tax=Methanomicrobium sp. W14 TaxID=2817839 RepID=UPI001AE3F9EA|nr:RNA-guided pseudouridylation complex pseudouridine synthase subunit Cbf5 [Methanomicrobium sp. W14]MBP2133663.1 putative rRNA pseudouridine synthase [Methanomicrobium sp. W14]